MSSTKTRNVKGSKNGKSGKKMIVVFGKERLNKEGSQVVTNCNQLKLTAEDGKMRLTDMADVETRTGGKGAGAVLGALYRNGYLKKVSGGRDKLWKLSAEADKSRDATIAQLNEVKKYWS